MVTSANAGFVGNEAVAAPMAFGCLRCSVERLAGRNYCGGCGKPLRPRCERKQVTVLFADVSGFTALSERLDPEQVSEIMHRTFDIVLEVVHEHGGRVNQFLGDGVMALFGEGHDEHHALRALNAALEVQERLEAVRWEVRRHHGLEFRVRMAINTGGVVVGTIGTALRSDYTATNNTTSIATQLLRVAQPGEIVITDRTRELTADRYDFGELREVAVSESETVEICTLMRGTLEDD